MAAPEHPPRTASDPLQTDIEAAPANTSPEISAPAIAPSALPPQLRSRVAGDPKVADWRLSLVQRVRHASPPGSRERAGLIAKVAGAVTHDWRGRPRTVSEKTLRRWIALYEAKGMEGLMRQAPSNAHAPRVLFSRAFDRTVRAAGGTEPQLAEIVKIVKRRVRSEWRSGTPSWPTIQLNTVPLVMELIAKAGVQLADVTATHNLCRPPRRFVEKERRFAILAMRDQDAAQFAAKVIPRIRRDRSHLRPCEWIAGDVHHLDIAFRRPDGTDCTPKAVAWVDLATNRSWFDVFVIPKGEMIRTEHVIQSFVAMCSDQNWGAPSNLYLDNGSEYKWTSFVKDIAKLTHSIHTSIGDNSTAMAASHANPVHNAMPYNPQAKVIETMFASLERTVFAQLRGYIGGNRMRKKTANQGRAPEPFPGDESRLREAIAKGIEYYHIKAQSGHLKGFSPNAVFARHLAEGWRSIMLNPWELAVAFSQETIKPVRAGGTLRLDNRNFRADALMSLVGQKFLVRRPLFGNRDMLFVFSEHGELITTAEPETVYAFGDGRGAAEQSRQAKLLQAELRGLAAQAPLLDGERTMAEVVALHGPAPQARSDGMISVDPRFAAVAAVAREAPVHAEQDRSRKRDIARSQSALINELARLERAG